MHMLVHIAYAHTYAYCKSKYRPKIKKGRPNLPTTPPHPLFSFQAPPKA